MNKTFYSWHFEEFFEDLREKVINDMKKEDSKYKDLVEDVINTEEKDIVKVLPEKEKQAFENYIDQIYDLNYMEQKYLYLQGFSDCMRLLKKAHVFRE